MVTDINDVVERSLQLLLLSSACCSLVSCSLLICRSFASWRTQSIHAFSISLFFWSDRASDSLLWRCWLADMEVIRTVKPPAAIPAGSPRGPGQPTMWVKKIPRLRFSDIFGFSPNNWEFLVQILHTYYTHLLYVAIYAGLQIFVQLSTLLTKLCNIKRDHLVHTIHVCSKCPPSAETHAGIFWQTVGNFWFTFYTPIGLLHVPILSTLDYKIFIQLPQALTKLCHIKCNHPACVLLSERAPPNQSPKESLVSGGR